MPGLSEEIVVLSPRKFSGGEKKGIQASFPFELIISH